MRTRVKICGITRSEDALDAATLGADAIGLVFYDKSPRAVTLQQAAAISHQLPAFVTSVALFLDADAELIRQVVTQVGVDLLQFHGSECADFCRGFGRPYIKALGMETGGTIEQIHAGVLANAAAFDDARGLLLDSNAPGAAGGTGETFDWTTIPTGLERTLILAGGLGVHNVAEAVRKLRPWAVDVSSGVEREKGIKDAALMQAFINEVNRCND
jgi:phosphoribosylanthranilate isomerase